MPSMMPSVPPEPTRCTTPGAPPTVQPPSAAAQPTETLPTHHPLRKLLARPAPPPSAPPGYEILGLLGQGGMGIVYQARQVRAGRVVALKMIKAGVHASADDVARFHTEAESIARLSHPNIVQVHEVGAHDGRPFFSL